MSSLTRQKVQSPAVSLCAAAAQRSALNMCHLPLSLSTASCSTRLHCHCSIRFRAKHPKDADAGEYASRHSSPSKRKPIHPSSPKGASWGSRHAQHIGSKPSGMVTGKGKKDPQGSKVRHKSSDMTCVEYAAASAITKSHVGRNATFSLCGLPLLSPDLHCQAGQGAEAHGCTSSASDGFST